MKDQQTVVEVKNLKRRLKKVSEALRDTISTFEPTPGRKIIITIERQEAWAAALERHGMR